MQYIVDVGFTRSKVSPVFYFPSVSFFRILSIRISVADLQFWSQLLLVVLVSYD